MTRYKIIAVSLVLTALILVPFTGSYRSATAASPSEFSSANNAILSAYAAVYQSQVNDHGDVSNLVQQLNTAAQLVNRAYEENSTNPTQAASDLQRAVTIAGQVNSETGAVSNTGIKIHNLEVFESIGAAVSILAVAGLIYITSDSTHRKWWVHTYRDYTLRLRRKDAK